MAITKVVSFGFKHLKGERLPMTQMFDVRDLDNPFVIPALAKLDGLHKDVISFVQRDPKFRAKVNSIVVRCHKSGFPTIAIGCIGGRHRSVVVAEEVGRRLGVPVEHLDIQKK